MRPPSISGCAIRVCYVAGVHAAAVLDADVFARFSPHSLAIAAWITPQTRFASSAVAVLPVPMAQTGSYAITMVEKSFTPCQALRWSVGNQLIRDALFAVQRFADAYDGLQVVSQRAQYLLLTVSSVSAKYWRRSLWPRITYSTSSR